MRISLCIGASLVALTSAAPATAAPGKTDVDCTALATLSLPHATVTAAEVLRDGVFHEAAGMDGKPRDHAGLPPFCRVRGVSTPVPGSRIGFELWLPLGEWNGRLHMVGNGAYGDRIYYPQMVARLQNGDVAVATDTGHQGGELGFGAGHPERIADWGHRAVHESVVAAKAVAAAFFGSGPRVSYFSGCSTGGGQALSEAQRYPADFDGIIAGDPGNNRTALNLTFLWQFLKNHRAGDNATAVVPPDKLLMVRRAAIAACDGLDGVKDGVINDPRQCRFDLATLACSGHEDASCLTAPQIDTLRAIYAGPRDTRTNQPLYGAFLPGSEGSSRTGHDARPGWSAYWANPRLSQEPQRVDFFRLWAFEDPNWNWWNFDWAKDIDAVRAKLSPLVDATNPDISLFHARGGKLILFTGWDDPVGAASDLLAYYGQVAAKGQGADAASRLADTQSYAELYMVPGMWHCAEGAGATHFSTATRDSAPPVSDARHDMAVALQDWVEHGRAPQEIIATKFVGAAGPDGKRDIAFQRPLCVFPKVAHYRGGPPDKAESFACEVPAEHP